MNMKINDEITNRVLAFLPAGMGIWLVGGFLRDRFLNRLSFDRDYVLSGENIFETLKALANSINGHFVVLDEERQIARIVLEDKINCLDFAKCSGKDIFEDLKNRDFSINALAYDVKHNEFIDTQNSFDDIKHGKIRALSEHNIVDDPLRVLRAYRFASQFGFEIESDTCGLIKKHQNLLKNVSQERVQTELIKLFEGAKSADVLEMMLQSGVLFEIFAELKSQVDVPPNLHHHLCLIEHSIETVRQLENSFDLQPEFVQRHLNESFGASKRYAYLKLATLLHDLGKPSTWTIEENGKRHRFIKHDEVGSQMAKPLLKRIKFGNAQISYIQKLIKHHIYPSQLIKSDTSQKALNRMYRRLDEETIDVILLAQADRLSARGEEITQQIVDENISGLQKLLEDYPKFKESEKPLQKLLSGTEIMDMFSLSPSPKLGELINSLEEAQLDGEVVSKEQAIEFIKKLL